MNLIQFKNSSIHQFESNRNKDIYLKSLWYDHHGDWERSHTLIQDLETKEAAAIHAYLHRKEGDHLNADYWYKKAGTVRKEMTLENEWIKLVEIVEVLK